MTRRLPILCPSSTIDEPRPSLLGVVTASGRVEFAAEPIPLTPAFIVKAKQGRDPSKRFRFTSTCIQGRCSHWQSERCVIADAVTDELEADAAAGRDPGAVPRCPIRAQCRWHHQRGDAACHACPEVIANLFYEPPAAG